MTHTILPKNGMTKAARMHQDDLMRGAMRDMTDNAIQAFIDRDPHCPGCSPANDYPMCRRCRWGAMAHAEAFHRRYRRNAPSTRQGERNAHHV